MHKSKSYAITSWQEKIREEAKEGWEYARLWGSKFHSKQRKIDLVRRRLWLRKMVTTNPDAEPIFTFTEDIHLSQDALDQAGSQKAGTIPDFYSPRMYITYRGQLRQILWAWIQYKREWQWHFHYSRFCSWSNGPNSAVKILSTTLKNTPTQLCYQLINN